MTNESKERLGIDGLGVYEETAPLKKVMMWGAPGAECALAQLLPENISCFWERFDVMKARDEFKNAITLIQENSPQTELIIVKELFAQMVNRDNITPNTDLDGLMEKLNTRADDFYAQYQLGDVEQVKSWMNTLVLKDVEKYGEKAAIVMNERLANFGGLPMANILYFRDQSNMIGKTWIWSRMKHEIRQPEVALCKEIILASGIIGADIKQIQVEGDGRFEGGDGIPTGGIAYIGVGGRTNLEGVMQVASSILEDGLRVVVVYDEKRDKGEEDEMGAMHFDTFSMPTKIHTMVACPSEVDRREVFEIVKGNEGDLILNRLGSLADFLKREEINIIDITKEEQGHHGSNFVNLGNDTVLQTISNPDLDAKIRADETKVINADFEEIAHGAGGTHCSMAAIERG